MAAVGAMAAQARRAERKKGDQATRYRNGDGHLCFAEYCPACDGTGWTKADEDGGGTVSAKPDCPNHPGMGVSSCLRCAGLGFTVQYGAAVAI
jgi:DnaJ-class molecular chaperone